MTSINPLYIFEIAKQKVDWGTILTPVNKIHDVFETFNTTNDKTVFVNGKDLSANVMECKDIVEEKDKFKNLDVMNGVKTILVNLSNACITKDEMGNSVIRIEMNMTGSDKKATDLIQPTSTEQDILSIFKDSKMIKKFGHVKIGKELNMEKKDILGLITAIMKQEYEKSSTKDGELKQDVKGEIGIIASEKQKYVELLDMTDVKSNPSLCDISDTQITNIISVTNIKKIRSIDDGKNYCIDLHTSKSYQQNRILTVNTTQPVPMNKKKIMDEMDDTKNEKKENGKGEMMKPDEAMKKSVLESYLASYLSTIYKDKDKWNVEWMKLSETSILVKIKNKDDTETIFHKFDATDAVLENGACPEYEIDPRVREFIYFQEFCKKDKQYKLKYGLVGSEHSSIIGLKIAFTKLVEAKTKQELDNFKNNIGKFSKAYFTSLPYYSAYSGMYNLGLYNSGIYTYPYSLGSVTPYYGSYYVPPVASTIVPTAPVVSSIPYTYTYPPITSYNNTLSLGSYYTPYTYSYASPFTYSYSSPYNYNYSYPYTYYVKAAASEIKVKNESKENYLRLIKSDMEEFDKFRNVKHILPAKVSNIKEVTNHLVDQRMNSINVEKISNYLYKVEFEKYCIKETHYYSFENDSLYHISHPNTSGVKML